MDRQALERCTIVGGLDPGEYCQLEVSDRGVGMDRAILDKIFDPFFTTKFQGRGLGLASAVGIVHAHSGALHVESEPGRGSTFILLLPRVAPVTATLSEPEPRAGAASGTILVVDDEDLVRKTTRRMLESMGYRVLQASSGSRAIALLEQASSIDLALIDLTMPEMNGEQTFAALRDLDSDLPDLFMSGHRGEEVALRVAGLERASHITKPFRMGALNQAVQTLLEHASA